MPRRNKTRFETISKICNQYLKEDGITLNFRGYKDTIRAYIQMTDNHIEEVFNLMIDCLLWSNYIHEIKSFILWKKEEAQLTHDYYVALEDRNNPSAELEAHIQKWKQRVKDYQILESHLNAQYKFFVNAYEQCRSAYDKCVKELGYHALLVEN